jgi:hypothetical protein
MIFIVVKAYSEDLRGADRRTIDSDRRVRRQARTPLRDLVSAQAEHELRKATT